MAAYIYLTLGNNLLCRLEIVKRLAVTSTSTVGELPSNLGISRQGARKQLQVLVNANVVHLVQTGRQTQVRLDAKTLHIAKAFISQLEQQWDNRLQALKHFVESPDELPGMVKPV